MRKRTMKRFLTVILAGTIILSNVSVNAAAGEVSVAETAEVNDMFQVQFDQEFAEVGQELSVTVTGAENVAYTWYIGGNEIDNASGSYTPTEADLENMIEVVVKDGTETASVSLYFSKLPVVYIDTADGNGITSKVDYEDATMRIQGNPEYNSETSTLYDGAIEIRGRGNTTWDMPKKPYKIKLDKKTDVFGMGKNKHWVLLANYSDESLMRNTLAYDFSGTLGMEHMSTVWTTVILNGEYVGNYQFCEQVRVDSTRVDVFDWEGFAEDSAAVIAEAEGLDEILAGDLETYMLEEDMSWITSGEVNFNNTIYFIADYPDIEVPSINGGYLLELDEYYDEVSKFKTDNNQPMMFKTPEFVYTNSDMVEFVQTYVQAFEDAVQSLDYTAIYEEEDTHYSELYDFDALIDYWLVGEIFFNEDLNKKSTYMYKEIDGLMQMGPVWDMDYSSGGEGQTYLTNRWATTYFGANAQINQWYKYLVKDPYFLMKAQERYWEIRYEQVTDMVSSIDEHYAYLKESGNANSKRWPSYWVTFESEVNNLKSWFGNHLTWMDVQMATEDSLTSNFYSVNTDLQILLNDSEGNTLETDDALYAPADYESEYKEALTLLVTAGQSAAGIADIYVNGIKYAQRTVGSTATEIAISVDALTADIGEKNVIEVKVLNSYGRVQATNYVTVINNAEAPVANPFVDVTEQDWYYEPVMYVYEHGIMSGLNQEAGLFGPIENITRAQFAIMLYRLEHSPEIDYIDKFTDVTADAWYADAVMWASEAGIIIGYGNGLFGGSDSITREQMATMMYRYAQYKQYDVSETTSIDKFPDGDSVSVFAEEAMAWAVGSGIISGQEDVTGNKTLVPSGAANRAASAAIFMRFIEKYEK